MTTFYSGRHRAARTTTPAHRAGAGILAATALSLGAATVTATSASANAIGPSGSQSAPAQGAQAAPSSTDRAGTFDDHVRRGDRGAVVEDIQQEVGATVDGVFGPQTESAVREWQGDNGLAVDGVVGPETGSAMGLTGGSTSGETVTATTVSTSGSDGDAGSADSSVLGTAESLVGTPYTYGGQSPEEGFDCSGFTMYVFAQHGVDLPRTADQQQSAATPVSDPQPGDLVFFGAPAWHVGIYAGDGMMYDSGSEGSTVTKRAIWTDDVTYGRF